MYLILISYICFYEKGSFSRLFAFPFYLVVKFNSAGSRLWATYYGGTDNEEGFSVATDAAGNVYLAGDTYSTNSIALGGFQNSLMGLENQFVVKFEASGNRICATYYGQAHDEDGRIAVDGFGNIYLTGITYSTSGIASGGFQNTYGGGVFDAYLVKFSSFSGIKEDVSLVAWNIYPNPASEYVMIDINTSRLNSEYKIEIFDVQGKQVFAETYNEETKRIDVSKLTKGIYFCTIIINAHGQILSSRKLILQ